MENGGKRFQCAAGMCDMDNQSLKLGGFTHGACFAVPGDEKSALESESTDSIMDRLFEYPCIREIIREIKFIIKNFHSGGSSKKEKKP